MWWSFVLAMVAQSGVMVPDTTPVTRSMDGLLNAASNKDQALADRVLELSVLEVVDPDFPPPENVDRILEVAARTVRQKLQLSGIRFKRIGKTDVAAFMAKHLKSDPKCFERLEPKRIVPGGKAASSVPLDVVVQHLKNWPLSELAGFFPEEERVKFNSYELIAPRLQQAYDEKMRFIGALKLPSGKALLDPSTAEWRSYSRWSCSMLNQNEADVVVTNTLLLLDNGEKPPPAGIFHKLKASGVAFASPKRQPMWGAAVVASTFSVSSTVPFFRELPPNLDTESEASMIGTFVLAHELGHALFKIPDFYDHPLGCLMTSRPNASYVDAYRELLSNPGPCAACADYLRAHELLFEFLSLAERGDLAAATEKLYATIAKAPQRSDGDYGYIVKRALLEAAPAFTKKMSGKDFKRLADEVIKRLAARTEPASQPATLPTSK